MCRCIFAQSGKNINIESGAYFGNGKDVYLGNNVGLGKNFKMLRRKLITGDDIMMGEDVPDYAIVGGNPARVIKYRSK